MRKYMLNFLAYILIIIAFPASASFGYEDISGLKGQQLADKLYSKVKIKSYSLNIEVTPQSGIIQRITTSFLEPDCISEHMLISSNVNGVEQKQELQTTSDGNILYAQIKSGNSEIFQFVNLQKVTASGISLPEFYRQYSRGNLYAFSQIYARDDIDHDSWEIVGKKTVDGAECWDVKFQYLANKGTDKYTNINVGCNDGLPRFSGIKVLSFTPYAPLTKDDFTMIPPKGKIPTDATEPAIKNYYIYAEQRKKTDASLPSLGNPGKENDTPAKTSEPEKNVIPEKNTEKETKKTTDKKDTQKKAGKTAADKKNNQ